MELNTFDMKKTLDAEIDESLNHCTVIPILSKYNESFNTAHVFIG